MSKEAMKLALEALEFEDMACRYEKEPTPEHIAKAITALRERLAQPDPVPYWHNEFLKHNTTSEQPAQPEQEPVAWLKVVETPGGFGKFVEAKPHEKGAKAVYTSPPAQRKPLTDEEILSVARDHYNPHQRPEISFARAIEAKLKEKNQ